MPPVTAAPISPPSEARRIAPTTMIHEEGKSRIDIVHQSNPLPCDVPPAPAPARLAVDHPDDPVDACGNPAGEIAGPEFRRDDLVDDAP